MEDFHGFSIARFDCQRVYETHWLQPVPPCSSDFPAFRAEGRLVGSSTSIEELKLAMDLWGHQQAGYVYDQKGANKSLNIPYRTMASGGCLIFRARD